MQYASATLLLLAASHCAFGALQLTSTHVGSGVACPTDSGKANEFHGNGDADTTCLGVFDDVTAAANQIQGLTSVSGPLSLTHDDAQSAIACPAGKILTSCRCTGNLCDGVIPNNTPNTCTASNQAGGNGVTASASCIDDTTVEGNLLKSTSHTVQSAAVVSCPAGSALVDCGCWSAWNQADYCNRAKTIDGNTCTLSNPVTPISNQYFNLWVTCVSEFVPPPPACPQLDSEHLETEYEAFLHVESTGFSVTTKDTFMFSVDVHNKYDNILLTTGGAAGTEVTAVTPGLSMTGQTPTECWSHYLLTIGWGDLVGNCAASEEGGPDGFRVYTCKVTVTADEDLTPIRSVPLTRYLQWELPVIVKFPKQVSAAVADLTAYQPPDVVAAITRQEVNVNVANLQVDVDIRLYTSVQWPFRLKTQVSSLQATLAGGFVQDATVGANWFRVIADCPDPGFSEAAEGTVDAPCNQLWQLDIVPIGGASSGPCQLDGAYSVTYQAECHPDYASDCPLVADDQGQIQNEFRVDYTLDSEYYCPQVVDSVDLTATLQVFKDEAHTVPATNFILGQMAYFLFDVNSDKVTVAATSISAMTYSDASGTSDVILAGTALPNHGLADFVVRNSDDAGVPADQVWVSFKVTDPPLSPPVDGSEDFSVDITCDVTFKNADGSLLLESRSISLLQSPTGNKAQPLAANVEVKMSAPDNGDNTDGETSSAAQVAVGVAAATAALALF